ncbi:MAG: hypothetical protein ACXVI0_10045 [Halobacteriota archaeon]
MKKQVIAVSLVLLAIVSASIAGVAIAQTQNATTDQVATSSTTSTARQRPIPRRVARANASLPSAGLSSTENTDRRAL